MDDFGRPPMNMRQRSPSPSRAGGAVQHLQDAQVLAGAQARHRGQQADLATRLESCVPLADRGYFKQALYVGVVSLAMLFMAAGLWSVYRLLTAFIQPMLWACLVGTAVFPFKHMIAGGCKNWLSAKRDQGTPLAVGVLLLPLDLLDAMANALWPVISTPAKAAAVCIGYAALYAVVKCNVSVSAVNYLAKGYDWLDRFMNVFRNPWVLPICGLYTVCLLGYLWLQTSDPKPNKSLARILSVPIWLAGLIMLANVCAPLHVFVLLAGLAGVTVVATGVVSFGDATKTSPAAGRQSRPLSTTSSGDSGAKLGPGSRPGSPGQHRFAAGTVAGAYGDQMKGKEVEGKSEEGKNVGNLYLKGLAGACALLCAVDRPWLLVVAAVPIFYAILRKTGEILSIREALASFSKRLCSSGPGGRARKLYDICVPHTVRDFAKLLFSGDQTLITALESRMDFMASLFVMVGFLCSAVLLALFVAVQLHSETSHLVPIPDHVQLVGTVMTEAEKRGQGWVADAAASHDFDAMVEQAVEQGRVWAGAKVRELASGADESRADLLEQQVLQLIDKVYEMYSTSGGNASVAELNSAPDLWAHLQHVSSLHALREELQAIVQENVGTLMAVAESIWSIISANITFLTGLVGALLFFVLDFGLDIVHFVVESIVFLTVLYYLLASSGAQWKPISRAQEMIGRVSVSGSAPSGSRTAHAMEQAISGVFLLSAKMATFYGLWTWFVHKLFALNIVFVPAALASVLAVVPLAAPWLVAVLGACELWLVRAEPPAALVFMLLSMAPMGFADDAFYKEVKGSHPYVTGLAVVGGMYWLGLQGALVGPMILCVISTLVAMLTADGH